MKKYKKKQKEQLALMRFISLGITAFIMVSGLFIGLLWFARPSISEKENRELTKFPSITLKTFLNGEYFSDISLWYSDTYPLRDVFIDMNQSIKTLYGFNSDSKMYGSSTKKSDRLEITDEKQIKKPDLEQGPDKDAINNSVQTNLLTHLYVEDATGYAIYDFNQEAADTYIDALNQGAKKLDGVTNVYSLIVPNNAGVMLSDEKRKEIGGDNEKEAIEYYYNNMENITGINCIDSLREHKDEYLYFRTDHHWTQTGSYYAYREFCKQKGFESENIKDFESITIEPFIGSYHDALQLKEFEEHPDSLTGYIPQCTNSMQYMNWDGNMYNTQVFTDMGLDSSRVYLNYIGTDKPFAIIDNPNINDGSSIAVVKESYGNDFVPWLADHYDKVYILDFRHTYENVVDFCKAKEVDDLIIMNNIQIIESTTVAQAFYWLL